MYDRHVLLMYFAWTRIDRMTTATGEGVPQDYVSAHMWLNLAAAAGGARGGVGASKAREMVADVVRPPHHVGGRRGDRSIMCLRAVCMTRAVRGLEAVLPHQPSHPFLRGADPLDPQLRPRFPVPFAMKR